MSNHNVQTWGFRNLTDAMLHSNSRYCEPVIKGVTSSQTWVGIKMDFRNLIDFDLSKGTLKLFAILTLTWTDRSYFWNRSEIPYPFLRLPVNQVWFPDIHLRNNAEGTHELTSTDSVRVSYTGQMTYESPQIFSVLCSPDVSKYPFDEHLCEIKFAPFQYNGGFDLYIRDIEMKYFWENSAWDVSNGGIERISLAYINIRLYLRRHAYFLMLNLVSPVLILGVMNVFVFVLPQESGERMGFSVTILLSFVVFISYTSQELPESNNSICIFNVFLLVQLIESALITLAIVIISFVYYMSEDKQVPLIFPRSVRFYRRMMGVFVKRKKNVEDTNSTNISNSKDRNSEVDVDEDVSVTWTGISIVLNNACFVFFIIFSVVEKSVVLVKILS